VLTIACGETIYGSGHDSFIHQNRFRVDIDAFHRYRNQSSSPLPQSHPHLSITPLSFSPIMSRRKAFETNLTGANAPSPSATKTKSPTKPSRKLSNALPPPMSPPNPEHSHATVPTTVADEVEVKDDGGEEVDDESTCFICAEPITFWSVGVCGHRTCQ
jgi:hypothetical protein